MSCKNSTVSYPAKVEVSQNADGQYRLLVDGKDFQVKGAGVEFGQISTLAENGGNAFRTWRTDNGRHDAIEVLDAAYEHNLMVLMGLEVGRERHGYDYGNKAWVQQQFDHIISEVERLKQHPALLGWAIGNELNLGQNDLRIFDAVNDISKKIHEIDPNHVTTTTLAGIDKRVVDYIKEHCTDIDFLSIQYYGEIEHLHEHLEEAGYDGPYMITEWGVTGHWEVQRTKWDVAIEPTSYEKAKSIINRYDVITNKDTGRCLGSFVFLWGQKQERTPTWYGMFLEDGSKTESVDAMHYLWTGNWPENRCPSIQQLTLNGADAYQNVTLQSRQAFEAQVMYRNYENDSLNFYWEIMKESTDLGWGGDYESKPDVVFSAKGKDKITINAPAENGAYRLFIYIKDEFGNAATANIPFLVK